MAEVVLFHHAHGLTPGVIAFADQLRIAGHTVHHGRGGQHRDRCGQRRRPDGRRRPGPRAAP